MAQIALPRHQVTQSMGTPLYQRRTPSSVGTVELVPNPHFVFPQQPPDSPPQTFDMAPGAGRRPVSLQVLPTSRRVPNASANAYKRRSASALPDFSFNPGCPGLAPPTFQTTPPDSPTSTTPTTPSKSIGHRRGASEFIGGGHKRVGSMVPMSSSPTKGDGGSPPSLQLGPPAGRKGHAHRRSGAISSHDLSFMMQPNANIPRIDQTPATPIERDEPLASLLPSHFPSNPTPPSDSPESIVSHQTDSDSSPKRPASRARVGFADTVEFIRPLSTISSETEGTVRGHSVSNSLNSVLSGASNPSGARMARPNLNAAFEKETKSARPSTAGAILDVKETGRHSFGDLIGSRRPRSAVLTDAQSSPSGNSATSRHHKKRSFFWLEHRHSDSIVAARLGENSSEQSFATSTESAVKSSSFDEQRKTEKFSSTCPRKSNGKPRKVKTWANSIIHRKPKSHRSKLEEVLPRRGSTPTLPTQISVPLDNMETDFEISPNFDVDDTVTIVSPTMDENHSRPKLDTDIASWKPRQMISKEREGMSPVIDLDAAMGPFNTPSIGPVPRSHGRGPAKKAMHSSLGMANHRRTESAPELVPFEFRNMATASGPTMADVFEEEEEEDTAPAVSTNGSSTSVAEATSAKKETVEDNEEETNTGIQVVETAEPQSRGLPVMNWNFDDAFSSARTSALELPQPSPTTSRVPTPVSSDVSPCSIHRESSPVEIVEDYEEPRASTVTRSSDSTITPTTTIEPAKGTEQLMHLSVPGSHPSPMSPDSSGSSVFPSPDFIRGQDSFDTARLGTAASSITDTRTLNSMNLGEPGPDCNSSVDDVPSLTSSRSTMTNVPHGSFPYVMARAPGDRTSSISSMSSMPADARRKRSSIASLSRLIGGGALSERSKLSIEQRPQSEHADKPLREVKAKKSRRVSRMLQFWKHKDYKEASHS
ncbi:uncharacterized protein K452DRAFT_229960 [Aplosporella prunicola CBS 121167]|uniref:Cell wall proline rich protein n=1 Tax=Aplosporella prunicola CBS 121167 TaxID=1176127 RepID=A0A6A6B9B5_9PEZI|nr:uncharacterized protein K452DRAFT_229960 [Aplosporella prunicola CBS 121167]KAF2140606.1 hypothetical protein K452DRAFT_229960 [Aplosporella prunicola CBS 121167]